MKVRHQPVARGWGEGARGPHTVCSFRCLGAAILGLGGDEVIHCILDVMYAKAPYTVLQRVMHVHPTVAELIPTMLAELSRCDAPLPVPHACTGR